MPLIIATPRMIASAVRTARSFRPASPLSATVITGAASSSIAASTSVAVDFPRSLTIRPSARKRMRSAIAAARASCVTISVVCP